VGEKIVEKHSATLGLPGIHERQIGLQSDHRSLCKFISPNDDGYKQVIHNIKWLVEDGGQAELRRESPSSSSPTSFSGPTPNVASIRALCTFIRFYEIFYCRSIANVDRPVIIPYPRNRDFVSSGDHLQRLDGEFSNYPGYHVRLAVCGIGGVG